MNTSSKSALAMLLSLGAATLAFAQTPPTNETSPSAASSPHQRDVTSTNAYEAAPADNPDPASASTPHQKDVTASKSHADKQKMMKECVAQEQARDSSMSKDDAKKTCMNRQSKTKSE